MVWALRDRLRGHARADLATSPLHMKAGAVSRRRLQEDGHHGWVSRRGTLPPSISLRTPIERAQTTCDSGRARSHTTIGPLAAGASSAHLSAPGAVRPFVDLQRSRHRWMRLSTEMDILERQGLNRSHTATANFVLLICSHSIPILGSTASITEFVRVWGSIKR